IIRGKESQRSVINKGHIKALCKIGFFGPTDVAISAFNENFRESEPLDQSDEENANEAVGFEWYSPLLAFYEKIDAIYKNEDKYVIIQVTDIRKGSTNGRDWTLIKGKTPTMGNVSAFLQCPGVVKKGDIIICEYRKGRTDTITITGIKLLD